VVAETKLRGSQLVAQIAIGKAVQRPRDEACHKVFALGQGRPAPGAELTSPDAVRLRLPRGRRGRAGRADISTW